MMLNPRYGTVGLVTLPMFFFFELLAPCMELLGYVWFCRSIAIGGFNRPFAQLFFVLAFFWGMLLSVQGLVLESLDRPGERPLRHHLYLTLVAALEGFGYRQLTLWWRVRGVWKFLAGEKSWGEMKRKGLGTPKKAA
jgi:hypothetical protein